jgi:hypothetical protein
VATVFYRCVCGETISLDTAQGGACDQCGRHFRAEVLREAFAATVSVPDPSSASTTQSAASNEDDSDALIGQTLGHYRIVGKLGQGGMGTVYRALDDSLERYVAIKVIDPKKRSVADTRQLQILFREAIAPLLASVVQAFWGITPGKKIFQLRIVDRHGLGPNRATLAMRMATQVLTIWAGVLFVVLNAMGLRPLGFVVTGLLQAGWLVDAGFAVFRRDGRSLHDLFFGTRVVLDAGSTPHA